MAARTTAVVSFAIFFIFDVGCSWRGAVANGGSWGGCVDNEGSCGVVLKLSNRFFGALAGVRFFFGFRPRLLGIGKQFTRSIEQALPGLVDRGALSRVGRRGGLSEPSCRSARCRQWNLRRP